MVGHGWETGGTQVDRIKRSQLVDTVLRHHMSGLQVHLAGPVKFLPFEVDAVLAAGCFKYAHALRHYFLADAVAGNYGCFYRRHRTHKKQVDKKQRSEPCCTRRALTPIGRIVTHSAAAITNAVYLATTKENTD